MSGNRWNRREFLEFLGTAALLTQLPACSMRTMGRRDSRFSELDLSRDDKVRVASGLDWSLLIAAGDTINSQNDSFGCSNDFIAVAEIQSANSLRLWVNHEAPEWLILHGKKSVSEKTKADIELEQKSCGGSFIRVVRDSESSPWRFDPADLQNRRVDGRNVIGFAGYGARTPSSIMNRVARGTTANCSGGRTPWGSILTAEENYQDFYGDFVWTGPGKNTVSQDKTVFGWANHFPENPGNYGWIVEINPRSMESRKLTALGRFAHEGALVVPTPDGRVVVYMGDDAYDQCIYKFVSDRPNNLEFGKLYVADLKKKRWISLDWRDQKILRQNFKSEWELKLRTRDAAHLVGGTKLDRPEGIARDPITGAIIVALTGNKDRKNPYGSLLKMEEENGNPLSKKFKSSTFLAGGEATGFSSPDNLTFDSAGNLWFMTDISGKMMKSADYEKFQTNSLMIVPRTGPQAGKAIRLATAPVDAEFTGPCFSPDGKTLFLSVQHPGETSQSREEVTSLWPRNELPRSGVIAITGPLIERALEGTPVKTKVS